jgi:hypothetical protein
MIKYLIPNPDLNYLNLLTEFSSFIEVDLLHIEVLIMKAAILGAKMNMPYCMFKKNLRICEGQKNGGMNLETQCSVIVSLPIDTIFIIVLSTQHYFQYVECAV